MKLTLEVDGPTADRLFAVAEVSDERVDIAAARVLHDALNAPLSRVEQRLLREAQVRSLHALELSDPEIAERVGITAGGVRGVRERLKLPAVGRPGPKRSDK